jgi:7-cyano-7-deazaguanine synthase in queuosine biosynthesis
MRMNQKRKKEVKKKRVVPFLNYTVNDFQEYDIISTMPETRKVVFDNMIEAIKFSLEKNKEEAEIFKLNENSAVSLNKKKWGPALEKAIEFYADPEREDYDKCKQCKEIMETIGYGERVRSKQHS